MQKSEFIKGKPKKSAYFHVHMSSEQTGFGGWSGISRKFPGPPLFPVFNPPKIPGISGSSVGSFCWEPKSGSRLGSHKTLYPKM